MKPILFVVASVIACTISSAGAAAPPQGIVVEHLDMLDTSDSTCFGFAWTAASDAAGQATSYNVIYSWLQDTVRMERRESVSDTRTTECWVKAPPGVEREWTVDVYSVRRGLPSDSSSRATWQYREADVPPPAPGPVVVDSTPTIPPPVVPPVDSGPHTEPPPVLGSMFPSPALLSPHYPWTTRTFTDFCYCWDGAKGIAAKKWAAQHYDHEMSGNPESWVNLNAKIGQWRYFLLSSTLDEANGDPEALTGKFLADMRSWYAVHPQYKIEDAFIHMAGSDSAGVPFPADSAHRVHPHIWSTDRFVGNPLDPGWKAYTIDRFLRGVAEHPVTTGIFLDEMDPTNLGKIGNSREYARADSLLWQAGVIAQVADLRAALSPRRVQINAAGYSNRSFPMALGVAAGAMHLEQMNRATQEMPSVWTLVDSLVKMGVYVDMVGLETWTDFFTRTAKVGKIEKYPAGGLYELPVYRGKVAQLLNYYMVVPTDARKVGVQIENVRAPLTPDSTDLAIYSFNVGHPKALRSIYMDTRDSLQQRARVYRRDFDNATVLLRPVTYWADTTLDNRTYVTVPLPAGGPWSYVKARGQIVPIDSLALRLGEGVILLKRD